MRTPSTSGSNPRIDNSPPVRGDTHAIIRIVDDLPAPLGPRNPNDSPRATVRSMPLTAATSLPPLTGKTFCRSFATIIAAASRRAGPSAALSGRPVPGPGAFGDVTPPDATLAVRQ